MAVNNNAAAVLAEPRGARRRARGGHQPRRADRDRRRVPHPRHPRPVGRAAGRGRHHQPHVAAPTTRPRSARRPPRSCACTSRTSAWSASRPRRRWPSSRPSPPRHGLPLVDDLGSGPAARPARPGRRAHRRAARSRPAPTVVCFSGDKLLGGPAGRRDRRRGGRGRAHPPPPAGAGDAHRQAVAGGARGDARALPRPPAGAARGARPRGGGRVGRRRARAGAGAGRAAGRRRGGERRPGRRRRRAAARAPELRLRARRRRRPGRRPASRRIRPWWRVVREGRVLLDCRTLTDDQCLQISL